MGNMNPIQTKVELKEYGIVVFEVEASTSKSARQQRKCRVVFLEMDNSL